MKSKDKFKRVPISEIPEVQEAVDLQQEIAALRAEHPEVFMKLTDLVDRYNSAIEIAEKVVRTKGVSCGPFENFSVTTKYDAQKAYDELGEDLFLASGGSISRRAVYDLDPKKVEAAIAKGEIPEECVDHFRTIGHSFHTPKKVVL